MNSHPQTDTVRVDLLTKIALEHAATDQAAGLRYADMAIRLARQLNQRRQLADAYLAEAKNYEYRTDLKDALAASFSALTEYQGLGSKPGVALCYMRIAYDYYAVANYPASLDYARKAVNTAQRTGNKKLLGQCLTALGTSYNLLADYPKAIDCYLGQLHVAEELRDTSAIASAMGNIGVVYYYLKKYPQALNYYRQCLELFTKLNNQIAVAAALNNIGAVYLETGDYAKVIDYNKKALTINRRAGMTKGEANDLMDMSLAYTHLNNYDDAFACLTKATGVYNRIGAKNNSSIALGQMASIYMDAPAGWLEKQGISPAMRLQKAAELQQRAVQLANETKNLNNEADQWKKLSLVYERQKNYEEALKSYRYYAALKDSVFNDKKQQEITRLTLQYDYDKKEADLRAKNAQMRAAASAEITRQKVIKNAAVIIGFVLILSGCTIFIFYWRRKTAKEKLREAEFKTQVAETELKALRAQLNPHFIFNSLNSISDYIARHDKATADIYLVKFAKLMRRILENSEQKTISLADDLKTLELYMQLEALRLDNKFLYEIVIEDHLDPETTMVPPMLLQPFVENSIWHGISPKDGCGKILIGVKKQGDIIEYVVEDNGIGRERSAALKKGKSGSARRSFGIKVIQSRINIINESRQARSKVEMTDLDEGTRVSIKLPYESSL
ncbi:MAG TPA: tetratricopeptide repeat protein [Mucilaginibacter sp.]|nr:tetratricopeptide repeat protein [Mucilaginibacter sp.]